MLCEFFLGRSKHFVSRTSLVSLHHSFLQHFGLLSDIFFHCFHNLLFHVVELRKRNHIYSLFHEQYDILCRCFEGIKEFLLRSIVLSIAERKKKSRKIGYFIAKVFDKVLKSSPTFVSEPTFSKHKQHQINTFWGKILEELLNLHNLCIIL